MNNIDSGAKVTPEVLCCNNGDNAVACDLMKRLRTLRSDSNYYGELLSMLCLSQNREALRAGKYETLEELFSIIDAWREGHESRLASIDGAPIGKGDSWLAWMAERKHPHGGAQYLTMTDLGSEWTDDPLAGLHFVRREDAERFAAGREDVEAITQHEFIDPPWKGQGPAYSGRRSA